MFLPFYGYPPIIQSNAANDGEITADSPVAEFLVLGRMRRALSKKTPWLLASQPRGLRSSGGVLTS